MYNLYIKYIIILNVQNETLEMIINNSVEVYDRAKHLVN